MALDDLLISTGVDQLIKLVKDKGRVEIGAAASELSQPIRTIEDWSHVLEDEGLVRVEYKLTKIFLVWTGPSREYVAQKSEKLEKKAAGARQDIDKLLTRVEEGGQELDQMEGEIEKLEKAPPIATADAEKLKGELAALEERYNASFETALGKMAALEKKLAAVKPKIEGSGGKQGAKGEQDFSRDLASLSKFESTLQAQLDETDSFFQSFQGKLEDFRKRIEEGKSDQKISELKEELASVRSLKDERLGAVEAIVDEQKAVGEKLSAAEKKINALSEREDSVAGAKRRLLEIRRLADDAKKQRKNVTGQLSDTLSLVKKQISDIREIDARHEEARREVQSLKDDYVDIAEEISRANEELSSKQKEISGRIALQSRAISGGRGGLTKEEVLKVSALIKELKAEQARMEQNLLSLTKQTEVLQLEAEGAKAAVPSPPQPAKVAMRAVAGRAEAEEAQASQGIPPAVPGGDVPIEFVEKVKLSAEEESEFEHKRDELRTLIRKMWEESKGDS